MTMDDLSRRPAGTPSPDQPTAWGRAMRRIPVVRVLWPAFLNYIFHQSPNNAGHVAFSGVLAVFPLVIFLSSTAAFIGEPGTAAELARLLADYAPPAVTEALLPAIEEALRNSNRFTLTVAFLGTLWAASSGAQALRMALNRAYEVEQGLNFVKARLKVLFFTLVGSFAIVFAFSSVVVMPYVWLALDRTIGIGEFPWTWDVARYGVASLVLFVLYVVLYTWLPDIRQSVRTVVPGAVVGVILWLIAAAMLSWTLRSAANLTPIYGSFAGVIATLIFFYVGAATIILGAEVNGVLRHPESE
jgi:membrane protein